MEEKEVAVASSDSPAASRTSVEEAATYRKASVSSRSSSDSTDSDDSIREGSPHRYDSDAPEKQPSPHISRTSIPSLARIRTNRTGVSVATNATTDPAFEVDFDEGENPKDWPFWHMAVIIGFVSFATTTV